jgi:hypothetical protein
MPGRSVDIIPAARLEEPGSGGGLGLAAGTRFIIMLSDWTIKRLG